MKGLKVALNRLYKSNNQFIGATGTVESILADKIEFEFYIRDMPGDGFVILNVETASVAPLSWCISEIEKKGFLSSDSHDGVSI